MDPLDGIAAADAVLGRRFPLPSRALPLARWTQVHREGEGVQIDFNLDDSRPGSPGRVCLYAGPDPGPDHLPGVPWVQEGGMEIRRAPLPQAQPSLRPVVELRWQVEDLHLRLTGQGPWPEDELRAIAASVG